MATGYIREWTQYRKLRNQLLLVLVGYFLLAATLFIVLPVTRFDIVFRVMNFCWLVLLVVVVLRLRHWAAHDAESDFSHIQNDGVKVFLRRIVGAADCQNTQTRCLQIR